MVHSELSNTSKPTSHVLRINEDLKKVDWPSLQSMCLKNGDIDETVFKDMIISTVHVLNVTQNHCPVKQKTKKGGKGRLKRELNSLKMKRRKINGTINSKNISKLKMEVKAT